MSKQLFFDEREYMRDDALIQWQKELEEEERMREIFKPINTGKVLFSAKLRWKNRKKKIKTDNPLPF